MDPTDLIWMNGEFVRWEDAKVHVLTHGLHYGTGVFEGIRCYDTELGPAIFRHADHLDRLALGRALLHADCPIDREQLRAATHELIAPQRPALLLHPPDRLPRLRQMGLNPLDAPVDVDDRLLGVGRLPRRGGQAAAACAPRSPPGGASAPTR